MNFASEASKLLTNKYFLYFMVFLAGTNVLGYLVTNKLNAVAFFALVSFLTYQFSKNMSVILLVALITTNFMMSNRMMREGLENQTAGSTPLDNETASSTALDNQTTGSTALANVDSTDQEIADALPIVAAARTHDDVANRQLRDNVNTPSTTDVNNPRLNRGTPEENAPEGFNIANTKKGSNKPEAFGPPRLDYAATIDQSYQHLDSILGSDSIKQLTTDTQKLMQQQQNLFNSMNQMVPVLESAKSLLSNFNIDDLQKSFKDISGLGSAPTIVA